ncbi:beta-ketoacyl synthase domain-containing protein [Corynespora cassiicola Philippines]|uniref:Beta-ketoacyl synthase domain-containing protein n=1 Tax=Corynespora cassiicola Philippines TaxID=1448308 RepID=A0A2T2NFQ6_CORCC|nr:beta-ketoacyl synthase domain-containing protein [Corynespora cassiicola Philippines]
MAENNSIAIIGLSCRFPGDATSPEKFWDLLVSKRDSYCLPPNRWNPDAFYHAGKDKLHTLANRGAHFLTEDVMAFDAAFFNISQAEATALDPQQRFTLELAYEAFENAGISIEAASGSKTGCFMGSATCDYRDTINRDPDSNPRYSLLGVITEMIANRTSWFYNLKGPSMTIQTACSSSLVALHLACKSLINGESDMALAGGVNLMLNPDFSIYLNNMTMSTKEGHCKSFDASGDGYSRGEGCGVVVLKRLEDALRDGDPVRAVIRGSGVNSDGFTQGITMPSSEAQARLIRDVYAAAGLGLADTQYIEAHGTGTKVGDPIECRAIYETLGKCASVNRKLILGSVKPNIGHLEGAASMAALIKGVLALEKGVIPPNLYFNTPNPAIPFDKWNLQVPTQMTPWPRSQQKRMSVSSFGVGGTNAHAILECAPGSREHETVFSGNNSIMGLLSDAPTRNPIPHRKRLFILSSHDQGGITRVGDVLSSHLASLELNAPLGYMADLAHTLGSKRSRLTWKHYCIASTLPHLRSQLASLQNTSAIRSSKTPSLGFVFTGQGAQWARMGVELLSFPIFKTSVDECDVHLASLGCSWRVVEELDRSEPNSRVHEPEMSQTLCTVLQIALVDLLRSYDVVPSRVVGHSSGEIAAAYCSGALTKKHAVAVAFFRGVASRRLKEDFPQVQGGMLAVGVSQREVEEFMCHIEDSDLVVACVNSPINTTVSGSVHALDRLQAALDKKDIFSRRLSVDVAYHSNHMHEIYPFYAQLMANIHGSPQKRSSDVPIMFSSVDGGMVHPESLGAFYWGRNLIEPVYFSDAVADVLSKSNDGESMPPSKSAIDLLVEIGPHSALGGPLKEILDSKGIKSVEYQSSVIRGSDSVDTLLELAGWLYARGYPIDVGKVNGDESVKTLTDLPPYPWNHSRRFDAGSRINREFAMRSHPQKSLLGAPFTSISENERIWRNHLRLGEEEWVRDHKVTSVVLFPGAGLVVMAIEAARQMADAGKSIRAFKLRDVSIGSAVVMNEDRATEAIIHLRPHLTGTSGSSANSCWFEFTVSTSGSADMPVRENCRGLIRIDYRTNNDEHADREIWAFMKHQVSRYEDAVATCTHELPVEDFYRDLSKVGLEFGPSFRNVKRLRRGEGKTVFEMKIGDPGETFSTGQPGRHHLIHPTTLDAMFSSTFSAAYDGINPPNRPLIPTFIEELTISTDIPDAVGSRMTGVATAKKRGYGEVSADIDLFDDSSSVAFINMRGFRCTTEISNESQPEGPTDEKASRLCSSPSWKHAFHLLEPAELQRAVESSGATSDSRVAKICSMLLHEQPANKLLELLPETEDTDFSIQDSISYSLQCSTPNHIRYAFIGSKSNNNSKNVLCLDFLNGPDENDISSEKFDIIVIPERCIGIRKFDILLSKLAAMLAPSGHLVSGASLGTSHDVNELCTTFSVTETNGFVEVYSAPYTNGIPPHRADVIILRPSCSSERVASFIGELLTELESHGAQGQVLDWGPQVSDQAAGKHIISLFELERSYLENLSASDFELIRTIGLTSSSLIWVTGFVGPSSSIVTGLIRSIRRENVEQWLQTLHMVPQAVDDGTGVRMTSRIICSSTKETEFLLEEDGLLKISRIYQAKILSSQINSLTSDEIRTQPLKEIEFPVRLTIGKPGLLDTLHFERHTGLSSVLEDDEVEICVEASGMNFRDVMISMGIIATPKLGYEACGVVSSVGERVGNVQVGDRVCAHVIGAHASVVRTKDYLCAIIPENLSFETGAAMPVVLTTAYHALVNIARVRRGQSVLIHAAAGGVGQAAIQLAQHLGLTIYATVSSEEKRILIKSQYGLPDEHIFYSRDASFAMAVKRITNGRGVDCVLNSLAGELLRESFYCLAPLGIMVEIGSRDALDNTRLDMRPFSRSATFACFNLLDLVEQAPEVMAEAMRETFTLVRRGVLASPHPLSVLPLNRIEDAFRMMQSGKHLGKLVITFKGNPEIPLLQRPHEVQTLSPDSTYLLAGGLGGLGRSLARMLVSLGARRLAFVSRSGASTADSQAVVNELIQLGATVKTYCADISDENALREALNCCSKELPPIKGVFQMAMLLRDSLYETMTHAQWVEATLPKIQGTWNLHEYFDHGHALDFFINLSSMSGIIGNKGQANYAAGSTFQDAIAHHRRSMGLKGLSLDLGIMLDVGVIAEQGSTGDLKRWEEVIGIREPLFHALMKAVIQEEQQIHAGAGIPAQICVGLGTAEAFDAAGVSRPDYLTDDIRFSPLSAGGSDIKSTLGKQGAPVGADVKSRLAAATSKAQAADLIVDALVGKVADILQTPSAEIDASRPIYLYGVDSLVAMEVRNWIRREMGAQVAIFDILEAVPITQLARKIAERSRSVSSEL